jgi:hypothetical protein
VHAKENGVSVKLYDDDNPNSDPIIVQGVVETKIETGLDDSGRYDEDDEEMVGQSSLENMHPPSLEVGEEEQTIVCRDVDLSPILNSPNRSSCVRLRAHISSNNHDYSEGSPERLICHWFSPLKITPSCSPFAGQREICVTGTGLLPTAQVSVDAIHTLRLPHRPSSAPSGSRGPGNTDEPDDDLVLEVAVPVRSECWEELSYTVPSLHDFFVNEEVEPPALDVINVEITFRTASGDVLTSSPFQFSYYSSKPVDVSPKWIRRGGGSVLTITGPGVLFHSEAARVLIVDTTRTSSNPIVQYDEFSRVLTEDGQETDAWKIVFTSPSLIDDPLSPRDDDNAGAANDTNLNGPAYVGLLLDGISQPQDSELSRVGVISEVLLPQSSFPAKGPVAIGTNVSIVASGLCPTGICRIRIRAQDGNSVETNGTIDNDCRGFNFVVPQSLAALFPEGHSAKHVEACYLEISLDGTTFDSSEGPYLQVKA